MFFARSVDLYLETGGLIGMVLPHSALRLGHYEKWRTGNWRASNGLRTLSVNFDIKPAWDLYNLEPNNFFPIPASVIFAENLGLVGRAKSLTGDVERWQGATGTEDVMREAVEILSTADSEISPYAALSLNGATIFPRRLFFIEEVENTALVRAGISRTVTVNPRRSSNDNAPWKDLDLTSISDQTVEAVHVFDVHLGETVASYVTLNPLKAVLPLRRGDYDLPRDESDIGGIKFAHLGQLMRGRWRNINRLWEDNKSKYARDRHLNLVGQLDYYGKLSSQLAWQKDNSDKPVRVIYTKSGEPTAAILQDADALVENVLYWIACRNIDEAYYIAAIINSDALQESAKPLMSRGQFGVRDLHKHLWKLPIPEYDGGNALHADISDAGKSAAHGASRQLARLRQERGNDVSVRIARRELRAWLRSSEEGKRVEVAVGELLNG